MHIRFFSILLACLFPLGLWAQTPPNPATPQGSRQTIKQVKVVLDAGHGGKDAGARGKYSYEKELTLAIVLRVGRLLNDSMKNVSVIYTRTTDIYPTLQQRHAIANQAGADLFVSVHINATAGRTEKVLTGHTYVGKGKRRRKVPTYKTIVHRETSTSGVMTLVLGNIRNNQKANAFGEYGEQVLDEPDLLDENNPQTAIIIAQYTQAFLGRSIDLATQIQNHLVSLGRPDLGVRQQSLEVLAGSYMPGVLVECGFINNPSEEDYMNSDEGQQQIAMAIFRGIKAYVQGR